MWSPRKILVVDDKVEICGVLGQFLTGQGYTVVTATSGEEALLQLGYERPDIVLLDVQMPDMSGLEVLREIRALGNAMRVVMITGLWDEGVREEALRGGADAYLTKPFRLRELEAHLCM